MYRTRQIRIKKGHKLYLYCRNLCLASAKLYNRGNFLVRQYATSISRIQEGQELTDNQKHAYELITSVTSGTKYELKGQWIGYGQLDFVLKTTEDTAYRGLPSQANQQILKRIMRNYKSFFQALERFRECPSLFKGRPKLPKYKSKDALVTAVLTNQICTIKDTKYLKFPGTKERLNIGRTEDSNRLKEVRIKPYLDSFVLDVVLQMKDPDVIRENQLLEMDDQELKKHLFGVEHCSYRIASIDPGTNNFCAITNNFGHQPFLISGRILKSRNQFYNKKLASLRSKAKKCNNSYNTKRISRLHAKRNRIIKDAMHKISRFVTDWAVKTKVDLVIMGHNVYQKQKVNLGDANNQNFVQMPFCIFSKMLEYKLKEKGIAYLETEEAYTSQADFLAMDPIPAYEKETKPPKLSGERIHRGLYLHRDKTISNADINGAANIMRKVFPNVQEWDRGVVDTPNVVCVA